VVSDIDLLAGGNGKLTVLVQDLDGKPVKGAEVFAFDAQGTMHFPLDTPRTNSDGIKKFRRLGESEYRLMAQTKAGASAVTPPVHVDSAMAQTITLTIESGGSLMIQWPDQPPAELDRLWVIDAHGRDFARAMTTFDSRRYITQGDGARPRRIGPLPPGPYTVRARLQNGQSAQVECEVKANALKTVPLTF